LYGRAKLHYMTRRRKTREGPTRKDQFRFLPVSPRERDWGLYVTATGYQLVPPHGPYPPTGHSKSHDWAWRQGRVLQEYAVIYVTRGKGEFDSKETGATPIEAGDAMLLFPGIWHRYRPAKEAGWEEYWVTFQGDYANRLRERGFVTPGEAVVHVGLDDVVQHAFTTLLDRVRSEACGFRPLIPAGVLEIIAGILEKRACGPPAGHVQAAIYQAKLAIEGSMGGLPNIQDLVDGSGLSQSYFFQIFKECTGLTPYQYRLQVQIGRAKELLHNSDLSVKQIGHMIDFPNIDQFSKMFKKRMGMTPSEYRNGGPGARKARSPEWEQTTTHNT
jgi:AraC-like DNA-binding protein